MKSDKKLFISFSHADREFATRFAEEILRSGQDVWFAPWELAPGDSLVNKIFEEGLSQADAFAVILSRDSVQSKWVREELNAAIVQRIERLTRVIPVLIDDVEIPVALRALYWVDMRADFDAGVRAIVNVIHGVTQKPPIGNLPDHIRDLRGPISGLSKIATLVGHYLLDLTPVDEPFLRSELNARLAQATSLTPEELNDAVDELETQGLVRTNAEKGTYPYSFGFVQPTYLLHHSFASVLTYQPRADVDVAIAAVASLQRADGTKLQSATGLSIGRLNRAVEFVKDHGFADVQLAIGTAPYGFLFVSATRITRQLAQTQ